MYVCIRPIFKQSKAADDFILDCQFTYNAEIILLDKPKIRYSRTLQEAFLFPYTNHVYIIFSQVENFSKSHTPLVPGSTAYINLHGRP